MAIINKDNNGYITPDEFNLFAKQAQLEIFEQYFYNYTNWVNKRNARMANDGYSDIQKQIAEKAEKLAKIEAKKSAIVKLETLGLSSTEIAALIA